MKVFNLFCIAVDDLRMNLFIMFQIISKLRTWHCFFGKLLTALDHTNEPLKCFRCNRFGNHEEICNLSVLEHNCVRLPKWPNDTGAQHAGWHYQSWKTVTTASQHTEFLGPDLLHGELKIKNGVSLHLTIQSAMLSLRENTSCLCCILHQK